MRFTVASTFPDYRTKRRLIQLIDTRFGIWAKNYKSRLEP